MKTDNSWKSADADLFWGDLAFHDHVLQVYDDEEIFIETLAGFVRTGIRIGDSCILIITTAHINSLNKRLEKDGVDVDAAIRDDHYIPLVAEELLPQFVIDGAVNEQLFHNAILPLLRRCLERGRMIRAVGEMVAILGEQGNWDAVCQLEKAWNRLHERELFTLYCAYPRSVLNNRTPKANSVCLEHNLMISGSEEQSNEIRYRSDVHL